MKKQLGKKFHLTVNKGNFTDSEIIVMLGENGTGKTTFIKVEKLRPFGGYGRGFDSLFRLYEHYVD